MTVTAATGRRRREALLLGLAGLGIAAALAAWATLVESQVGGDAAPLRALLAALAAALVAARLLSALHGWAVPAAVVASAGALALVHPDPLLARPLGNPLGYSNAVGALYVQAAAAALIVLVRTRLPALRVVAAVCAVAFAAVPWLNNTDTAAVLTPLLLVGLAARRPPAVRRLVATGAVLAVAAVTVTAWLGWDHDAHEPGGRVQEMARDALSERRLQLWQESIDLVRAHPLTGVGPGRFADRSPTALGDRDAGYAHHALLQLGAETGVPGLVLGLGLLSWVFAWLWRGPAGTGTAIAAVAVTALAVHSSVDFVLHVPAVGLAAAAVAGAGHADPRTTRYPRTTPRMTRSGRPAG